MSQRKVRITNTGYLPNSPDRHNPMNIIPSNQITMNTVPFPILGVDNLGNKQMMMPGMNYTFPGQYVTEIPLGKYQKGRQVVFTDPVAFRKANQAYADSSSLYNAMVMQNKLMSSNPINADDPYLSIKKSKANKPPLSDFTTKKLKEARIPTVIPGLEYLGPIANDFNNAAELKNFANSIGSKNDIKLVDYYKSLGFNDDNIMYHTSADVVHPKIKPVDAYWDGSAWSPVYKKPETKPVFYPVPSRSEDYMTRDNSNAEWFDKQVQRFTINGNVPIAFNLQSVDKDGYHTPIYAKQIKEEEAPTRIEPLPIQKLPVNIQAGLEPYVLPEIKGKKTTPIMQASYAHRSGQYQTGENVWNEDKKKWERRMFKDEEADWHRNNGRIKRDGGLVEYQKKGEVLSSEEIRNEWNRAASQYIKDLYRQLDAEKERVAKVRANVPVAAKQLDEGDNFRHSQGLGEDLRPYQNYLGAKNPKELEAARQALSPRIKNLLINQGKYNVAQWDASKGTWNPQATPARELYCTPYGCFTYQLAGATDVPIVSGNMGFVDMVKTGKLPFEKVSNPEEGDMGVLVGAAPKVYTKPELGNTIRPHHTVIYDSTDANGNVNAYNAYDGSRLNYTKTNFQLEPSNANSTSQYMDYYRYVGNTKKLQNKVNEALKSNPKLRELEEQLKRQIELENKDALNRIQPLDMKPIRSNTSTNVPELASKKYGGLTHYQKKGQVDPKSKGWKEYKTATNQSFFLDPRFKNQRYYVDEKGNTFQPNQNSMIYDVASNAWESPTLESTLEIRPRYRYEKRPGALGSFETVRIDDDNNTSEIISPNPMETLREQEAFVNSINPFNPAALAFQGVTNMAQGNIAQGALETAFSIPIVGQAVGKVVGAPFKFIGNEIAQTYGPALSEVGRLATTKTPLKHAYKINPYALKENPEALLYRARPVGQNPEMTPGMALRAKKDAGEPLTWWQEQALRIAEGNAPDAGRLHAREKYFGKYFDNDPRRLGYYMDPGTRNFADDDVIEILRARLPKAEADKLNITNFPEAAELSFSHPTEFILPTDVIQNAERFPESSWQQLIDEHEAFNTPHWWKGYSNTKPEIDWGKEYFYKLELKDKELQKLVSAKKITNKEYTESLKTYREALASELGADKKIGSGRYGSVYTLQNKPHKVIKIGMPLSRGQGWAKNWTPDIIEDLKFINKNGNIAIPEKAEYYEVPSVWGGSSTTPQEVLHMRNLNIPQIKNLGLNKRDRYAYFLKQARQLRDKGVRLDYENPDNFKFNKDTGIFDIYDVNPYHIENPVRYMEVLRDATRGPLFEHMDYKKGGIYLGEYEFKNGGLVKYQNKGQVRRMSDEELMFGIKPEVAAQDNTYVTTPRIEEARRDDAKGLTIQQKKQKEDFTAKLRQQEIDKKKAALLAEQEKAKKEELERQSSLTGISVDDLAAAQNNIKYSDGTYSKITPKQQEWFNAAKDDYFTNRAEHLVNKQFQPFGQDVQDFADIAIPAIAMEALPYALPYVMRAGKTAYNAAKNIKLPKGTKPPQTITIADDLTPSSKWLQGSKMDETLPPPPPEQNSLFPSEPIYFDYTHYSDADIAKAIDEGYGFIDPKNFSTSNILLPEPFTPSKSKDLLASIVNGTQSAGSKIKSSIINLLDSPGKYKMPDLTGKELKIWDNLNDLSRKSDMKLLPTDNLYRAWGNTIFKNAGDIVPVSELRAAHAKAIEHFKDFPFVTSKDMGLFMREQIADKLIDFKLPQIVNEKGIPFIRGEEFTPFQMSDARQAATIREALNRRLKGFPENRVLTPEEARAKALATEFRDNTRLIDHKRLAGLSDANFTPEQRNLLHAYARGYDKTFNEVLRANHDLATLPENTLSAHYLKKAEELKQALLQNKLDSEKIPHVLRGVNNHKVELVDPKTLKPTGEIIDKIDLQPGQHFLDRSFASTTYGDNLSFGTWNASEKVMIPPGKVLSGASPNMMSSSPYLNETEVVLPPNLVRRVDKVFETGVDGPARFVTSVVNPYKQGGSTRKVKISSLPRKSN